MASLSMSRTRVRLQGLLPNDSKALMLVLQDGWPTS